MVKSKRLALEAPLGLTQRARSHEGVGIGTAHQPEWQELQGGVPHLGKQEGPSVATVPSRGTFSPVPLLSTPPSTSSLNKAPKRQTPGQGLLLRCNQEILFSQDIFSRKQARSKCHVSRLLLHGNFGLFKEMVITLLPP